MKNCCVRDCTSDSDSTHPGFTFFNIPKDPKRCTQWLRQIQREDLLKNKPHLCVVCQLHFRSIDILLRGNKKTLKTDAMPTLKLPKAIRPRLATPVVRISPIPLYLLQSPALTKHQMTASEIQKILITHSKEHKEPNNKHLANKQLKPLHIFSPTSQSKPQTVSETQVQTIKLENNEEPDSQHILEDIETKPYHLLQTPNEVDAQMTVDDLQTMKEDEDFDTQYIFDDNKAIHLIQSPSESQTSVSEIQNIQTSHMEKDEDLDFEHIPDDKEAIQIFDDNKAIHLIQSPTESQTSVSEIQNIQTSYMEKDEDLDFEHIPDNKEVIQIFDDNQAIHLILSSTESKTSVSEIQNIQTSHMEKNEDLNFEHIPDDKEAIQLRLIQSPDRTEAQMTACQIQNVNSKKEENFNYQHIPDHKQELFLELCYKYLPKEIGEIVKAQIRLKHSLKNNQSLAFKLCCLDLFLTSPQCYVIMEKLIGLPRRTLLTKINTPISTRLNDDLINVLKLKVSHMSEMEKQCCVVIGTTRLKPNLYYDIRNDHALGYNEVDGIQGSSLARHAFVLIARGLLTKWSQPVGYAFIDVLAANSKSSNDVAKWINKTIAKLFDIGLKVKAFVGDQNIDGARYVLVDKPFFCIKGEKVCHIYDVPQLIKYIRNIFMTFDFNLPGGGVAKFSDIMKFYELDQSRPNKLAPKLTWCHMNVTNNQVDALRYAVDLFSKPVAVGMSLFVDFKWMDESARDTARFVHIMNDFIEIMNTSTISTECLYKSAFTGAGVQRQLMQNVLKIFGNLESIKRESYSGMQNRTIVNCLVVTIQAVLFLSDYLKREGYDYLFTKYINQEVTEDFFARVKVECKTDEPTARQFKWAFRKLCLKNNLATCKKRHSGEDVSKFMLRLTDLMNINHDTQSINSVLCDIKRIDYNQIVIPIEMPMIYVSGWLLGKCAKKHKECEKLKSYMDVNKNFHNQSAKARFSKYRHYLLAVKTDLETAPPDQFIIYVDKMEGVFRELFLREYRPVNVGNYLYEAIQRFETFTPRPCNCFPIEYLQKLFIRMRIFTLLRHVSAYYCLNSTSKVIPGRKFMYL